MSAIFDIFLLFLGFCFIIAGLIGCVFPAIPGPPMSFIALLLIQVTRFADFSGKFLWIAAIVTVVVTVVDYIVPAWGTKKFGGSRAGAIGSVIGVFVGMLFLPFGIIAGPFAGAVVGELIAGRDKDAAFRSGFGSLIGFIFGVAMKLTVCVALTYYFIKEFVIWLFV